MENKNNEPVAKENDLVDQVDVVKDNNNQGLINKNAELLNELKTLKAKTKKYEDNLEAERQKKLEEDGKYKELIEVKDTTISNLQKSLKQNNLKLLATDFQDSSDILNFQDRFEFDDTGNIVNAESVINEIKETKPYLFKNGNETQIKLKDNPTPPAYVAGKKLTNEMINNMTSEEYKKNLPEINRQLEAGTIQ
ncbi:MAG: hypothetical protein B6I31_00050 [Desulfobacteraceae bacterium 4572_19]|nr:MAG: hypothetical protein B6I31_00050 [Desulfobacteraceae bacterium 4572_19]